MTNWGGGLVVTWISNTDNWKTGNQQINVDLVKRDYWFYGLPGRQRFIKKSSFRRQYLRLLHCIVNTLLNAQTVYKTFTSLAN